MSFVRRFSIMLVCGFSIVGCSAAVNRYGVSVENVEALKSIQIAAKVNVSSFTSDKPHRSIICRGVVPIEPPDGKTFEEFIRDAFVSELRLAGLYDGTAKTSINGYGEKLDYSSVIGSAKWMFRIRMSAEGKESFVVDSEYPFSASYVGNRACQEVPQAFGPAVQQLIKDIVGHPKFAALVR